MDYKPEIQILKSGLEIINGKIELKERVRSIRFDVGLSTDAPNSAVWISRDPSLLVVGFEPVSQNRISLIENHNIDLGLTEVNLTKAPKLLKEFISFTLKHIYFPINAILKNLLRKHISVKINSNLIRKQLYILPCALGSKFIPEGVDIYVTKDNPGCSSLLEPIDFKVGIVEKVPVLTLAQVIEFFPEKSYSMFDHLKIDAQGSDLEILKGAGDYLKLFKCVTVECMDSVPQYKNANNDLKSVEKFMSAMGFSRFENGLNNTWQLARRGINLEVDDPTFTNNKWLENLDPKKFWAYQRR